MTDRELTLGVGEDPRRGPQLHRAFIHKVLPRRQVGVLTGAERAGPIPGVDGARLDLQPVIAQSVADADLECKRPAGLRIDPDPDQNVLR